MDATTVPSERPQLFERESVMVNEPDYRQSITSVFDDEKRYFDSANKRLIMYFTAFAVTEFALLYVFQRYFYMHKSYIYYPDIPEPRPILDFEIAKYYFYRSLSMLFVVFNRRSGPDHVALIVREFRENQSFLIFVLLKVLLSLCTVLLIQYHPVATVLFILNSKAVYAVGAKVIKRYQLRNAEFSLLAVYFVFVIGVYTLGPQWLPFSLLTIVTGGLLFYTSEELINTHINLQEWEVLRYIAFAFVSLLFLTKELLSSEPSIFGFEWSEIPLIFVLLGLDYARVFGIKRIHVYVRETTSRIYFPLMIVFVGAIAVTLDLVLTNRYLTAGEFVSQAILQLFLMYFYSFDLKKLFTMSPTDPTQSSNDDLLIHK